jgi:flagellar biosynthesis protein FliQ
MTIDTAIELCRSAALLSLTLCGPVLLAALAVGLVVGLAQALTQLQDPSLTFVPKLIALTLVLLLLLPWGLNMLAEYATELIRAIPGTI